MRNSGASVLPAAGWLLLAQSLLVALLLAPDRWLRRSAAPLPSARDLGVLSACLCFVMAVAKLVERLPLELTPQRRRALLGASALVIAALLIAPWDRLSGVVAQLPPGAGVVCLAATAGISLVCVAVLARGARGSRPSPAVRQRPARIAANESWWRKRPWFLPEGRRLPGDLWQKRHRGLTALLALHVPGLIAYGLLRGVRAGTVLPFAGVLLGAVAVSLTPQLSRGVRSASTSLGLVIGASEVVHLSGGAIEAHFQFFVVLSFLTLYQSWLPYLVALGYVVLEHGLVGAIDARSVYDHPGAAAHPWRYAAIHGGFVLAASVGNVLSWRLTEQEGLRDSLTGLPNRVALLEGLDKLLERRGGRSTSVLFIDLDNFKDANDAFGHEVGDQLLVVVAERLRRQVRCGDLLARLGGDEFAVVLSDVADEAEGLALGERVLASLAGGTRVGEVVLEVGASIGLALADGDAGAAELLRNADLAMYEAKREGGGRVTVFHSVMHAAVIRRNDLDADLRVALERSQFVLHYQPIYDLTSRALVGTEALVRWEHPVRGLVPPAEFIPAAEQSGLIVALGAWVLRTACVQTAAWHEQHPDQAPITVAVNLSPRQLVDRSLFETVSDALHESGLDPAQLCLEITEGSVIKDFEASLRTLRTLRALGVSLALDDFGTGYSSLSYLQQLPVDSVKIDRSFVQHLTDRQVDSQIVLAIIELAHVLGLSVTAEGAETPGQVDVLRTLRADHVQGFLLGRPVPAAELTGLLSVKASAELLPVQRLAPERSS